MTDQAFYGKYNNDPTNQGRIRARVPDILTEEEGGWAMPSVPYAGKNAGLYLMPPVGTLVWIEFEHGDSNYPIWSGCFWAAGELPTESGATDPDTKVLKTDMGTITVNDKGQGSITIEILSGAKVVLDSNGIEIDNGKGASIKLRGNMVSINDSALEVT
jgi:uncharacterized protein involved in type VI secretion and phage assembly